MVFEAVGAPLSLPADANAINIARFVTLAATGISESGGGTDEVVGVSMEAVAAGNDGLAVPCARPIGCKVEVTAGAAVAAGALVMSDATGRAITATATNKIHGQALTAAAAAGEVITILFFKGANVA
jgi:hypothetical protein